ncbi:hypothetical protein RZS08_43425, partial [Arthrospira platensis SPKY1]|nr:hypothetical protein [Arthrospira platensis SPKY1]
QGQAGPTGERCRQPGLAAAAGRQHVQGLVHVFAEPEGVGHCPGQMGVETGPEVGQACIEVARARAIVRIRVRVDPEHLLAVGFAIMDRAQTIETQRALARLQFCCQQAKQGAFSAAFVAGEHGQTW